MRNYGRRKGSAAPPGRLPTTSPVPSTSSSVSSSFSFGSSGSTFQLSSGHHSAFRKPSTFRWPSWPSFQRLSPVPKKLQGVARKRTCCIFILLVIGAFLFSGLWIPLPLKLRTMLKMKSSKYRALWGNRTRFRVTNEWLKHRGLDWKEPDPEPQEETIEWSWPYRYEKVGMDWKPEGVEYRNAPWMVDAGEWFVKHEQKGQEDIKEIDERRYGQVCPNSCAGNGVCNYELGACQCFKGFSGIDCNEDEIHECNLPNDPEAEIQYPFGPPVSTTCAAHCDMHTARCFCGPNTTYPTRPVVAPCGFVSDTNGQKYDQLDLDGLFSTDAEKPGWCNANLEKVANHEQVPRVMCFNNYDGFNGEFSEIPVEPFCINQCNMRGDCISSACHCKEGWYGIDCSIPSSLVSPSELEQLSGVGGLPTDKWLEVFLRKSDFIEIGHTDRIIGGVEVEVPFEAVQRERPKPLIYVYDLPAALSSHILESRHWKYLCAHRLYADDNETITGTPWNYGHETAILEAFLTSPHRTNNAEEADFFVVPFMPACLTPQVDEAPHLQLHGHEAEEKVRPQLVMDFTLHILHHLRTEYPFWNKTDGRTHIWLYSWDEGSCHAPHAIQNSILITSWGNTMEVHNHSTSGFGFDNWEKITLSKRGVKECYDFTKDIVVPSLRDPAIINLDLMKRTFEERPHMFCFRGNLGEAFGGREEPEFSLGIRQQVAKYFASVKDKDGKLGEKGKDGVIVAPEAADWSVYAEELSRSRFCGVFPADGFSPQLEDAVLHGCIPVIIQDGIHLPFESFLDFNDFSIRIAEADIPDMITILESIPELRVRALLDNVKRVWQRFNYRQVWEWELARRKLKLGGQSPPWAQFVDALDKEQDDAVATIFRILRYKLDNDV